MNVRYLSRSLVAVTALVLSAGLAHAADCTVPEFDPQQHSYLSPTLQQDAQLRDRLNGLSAELVTAGSGHQIIPYFVGCQASYKSGVPGVQLSHDVFEKWKTNSAFPSNGRVVVIAWVRNGYDTNHGSVGATAGQELQSLGFTGDYFASNGGPVLNVIRQYMPDDPKGEFVHIVREMDDEIAVQIESAARRKLQEEQEARQEAIDSAARAQFVRGLIPCALGGFLIFLVLWVAVRVMRQHEQNERIRDSIRSQDSRINTALSVVEADFATFLAGQIARADTHVLALAELRRQQSEVTAQMRSNPSGSLTASTSVLEAAELLQSQVHRTLELQTDTLPGLVAQVASVSENVRAARKTAVAYAFPGIASPAGLPTFFELTLEGGNPDVELSDVDDSIASAKQCLTEGNVDEAQTHVDAATSSLRNANAIVTDTLAAKSETEALVLSIQEVAAQLLRTCDSEGPALAQLKAEFAPVNFEDVVNNIEKGRRAAMGIDAVITEAAAQYFKQDFVTAKSRLQGVLDGLRGANTDVSGISKRLRDLEEKRATLLSKVGQTGQTLESVDEKLRQNSGYASLTTKQGYERLQEQQRTLNQISPNDSQINWLAMWLVWEAFHSGASNVSSSIDLDRSSHEVAQRAAAALASAAPVYTPAPTFDMSSTMSIGGSGGGNY